MLNNPLNLAEIEREWSSAQEMMDTNAKRIVDIEEQISEKCMNVQTTADVMSCAEILSQLQTERERIEINDPKVLRTLLDGSGTMIDVVRMLTKENSELVQKLKTLEEQVGKVAEKVVEGEQLPPNDPPPPPPPSPIKTIGDWQRDGDVTPSMRCQDDDCVLNTQSDPTNLIEPVVDTSDKTQTDTQTETDAEPIDEPISDDEPQNGGGPSVINVFDVFDPVSDDGAPLSSTDDQILPSHLPAALDMTDQTYDQNSDQPDRPKSPPFTANNRAETCSNKCDHVKDKAVHKIIQMTHMTDEMKKIQLEKINNYTFNITDIHNIEMGRDNKVISKLIQ